MRKPTLVFLIVLGLLILCTAALLFVDTSCASRSAAFLAKLEDLDRRWFDALEAAENAPLTTLDGSIAELQAVRNDAQELRPPECAKNVQISLNTYMDYVIAAFQMTEAQEPDDEIVDQFNKAWEWEEYYFDDLAAVKNE